jgi:hypothetical protein
MGYSSGRSGDQSSAAWDRRMPGRRRSGASTGTLPARLERIAWIPVMDSSTPKYTSWWGACSAADRAGEVAQHQRLGHAVAKRVGVCGGELRRPGQVDLVGSLSLLVAGGVPDHPKRAGVAVAEILHQAPVAVDPHPRLLAGLQEAVQRLEHRSVVQAHHQQRRPPPTPTGPLQRRRPARCRHHEATHLHRPGVGDGPGRGCSSRWPACGPASGPGR